MKSPRQVRSDIRTLTTHIGQVRDALMKKVDVTVAQVGKEYATTKAAPLAAEQLLKLPPSP